MATKYYVSYSDYSYPDIREHHFPPEDVARGIAPPPQTYTQAKRELIEELQGRVAQAQNELRAARKLRKSDVPEE